jgi:Holliday junction DNA helicase RuvA
MIGYLKGNVKEITKDSLIIDVNNVGYNVICANPYSFIKDKEYELYIYTHVREDQISLFGFKTLNEKDAFLRTLQVKGIGPKTAIGIFAAVDYLHFVHAIDDNNVSFLKKLPGIGLKSANQIILDLKGKLELNENVSNNITDAKEALIALGYKENDIVKVFKVINKVDLSVEDYIKQALALLLK